MLRRLGIRAKVLAVLAVPVLVLLLTAAYVTQQSVNQARTAATVSDVVDVLPLYARTAEALQQERTISMQVVGDRAVGGNLQVTREATDTSIDALEAALRDVDLSTLDPRVSEAVENSRNHQVRLADIRGRIDSGSSPEALVDSNYTDVITADNDVPVVVAETLSERSLGSRLSAYGAIAETIEQVLRAQPRATEVLEDDGADATQVRELATVFAVQDNARTEARTVTNNLRLEGIQLPSRDSDYTAMMSSLTSGNQQTVADVQETRWNSLVNGELASLRPVATDLLASAADRADTVAAQARDQAVFTAGTTLAAAILSIVIAFIVSRGIVVPMRRLTAAAGTVREELPRLVEQVAVPGQTPDLSLADIPVESQDEVGRLAQAFNDVNATTIQVAREQAALRGSIAEMFVNVARRDQVLLGRQLAFIDSLERAEEDPATLANLFRLDHLATRMRRNAESLLVLAGIDSGRRLREAMPLSDVVRTASSEIEQYDRVQLELRADPLMHGFNALSAAHLLAELLENATVFSEPGTPVVVLTDVDGDHVVVRVVDQGLGMSEDEIAAANATIASTSPTEALGAQRLGLFVVARLAQRLGARVVLERAIGDVSGTAAVVRFPVGLFTANDPALAGGAPQRSAAPAAGSLPEVEAPVAAPVDLAALTDGSTGTGLPRRRTADAPAAPAARSDVPTEQDVVLPAPAEATLAPEIAAEASGWTPLVAPAPDAPAALPSRGSLPTRGGLPSRTPAPADDAPSAGDAPGPVPASPGGPRAGLFAGFRGRDLVVTSDPDRSVGDRSAADEPAADQPVAERLAVDEPAADRPEQQPTADLAPDEPAPVPVPSSLADPLDREPELSAEDHAHLDALSAPLTAGLPVVAPAAPAEPAHEPAHQAEDVPAPAMVVPGLVPDEPVEPAWAPWTATTPVEPAAFAPDPAVEPSWGPAAQAAPVADEAPAEAAPAAWSSPVADLGPAPIGRTDDTQWLAPVPQQGAPFAQPSAFTPPAPAAPQSPPQAPVAAQAPVAPQAWVEQPAAPAPADPAPLPDFATVLRGDEPAEPAKRVRQKRSFFSLRRKDKDSPAPAESAAAAPAPVAAPMWPATSTPGAGAVPAPQAPAAPVRASALPAPAAPAPVEPVAPAASQTWSPEAAWAPATEQQPVPSAPAEPTWPAAPAAGWGAAPQATDAPGWGAPASAAAYPGATQLPAAHPNLPAQGEPVWSPAAAEQAAPTWAAPPSAPQAGAPQAGAPLPTRTRGAVPPPAPEPAPVAERRPHRDISAWASSWSPDGGTVPQPAPAPSWSAQPAAPATPAQPAATGARQGGMDSEAAAMLGLRADIQEQALSELSQLSAYRPQVDVPAGGSLTRRVPTAIPAAPEISQPDPGQTTARDADGLRDRFASFQSGSRRGRRALEEPDQGQSGDQPEQPRSESDHQPVPPSPSW